MKLRPSIVVDIVARYLSPAENMAFACLLGRVPELVDEVARLESSDFKSEDEVADNIRELLQNYGGAAELEKARSIRTWVKSLPPPPRDENLPKELQEKLDAFATALGVPRDALVRAGLEMLARLPEEARSITLGSGHAP